MYSILYSSRFITFITTVIIIMIIIIIIIIIMVVITWTEVWDRSTMIPSLFISCTTVCK